MNNTYLRGAAGAIRTMFYPWSRHAQMARAERLAEGFKWAGVDPGEFSNLGDAVECLALALMTDREYGPSVLPSPAPAPGLYHCRKCGYAGATGPGHVRPDGRGECNYIASAPTHVQPQQSILTVSEQKGNP